MAKILNRKVSLRMSPDAQPVPVYSRLGDEGQAHRADDIDMDEAKKVGSAVYTKRLVHFLVVMQPDGAFRQLTREEIDHLEASP